MTLSTLFDIITIEIKSTTTQHTGKAGKDRTMKRTNKTYLMLDARYTVSGETIRGVYAIDEIRIKPIANTNRGQLSIFGGPWAEIEIAKLERL